MDKHPFEYQKEALVEIFARRAYTNVLMVTGYAGTFVR